MAFDQREYMNEWRRKKRKATRISKEEALLKQGKCPICEMLLKSKYHYDCPYSHTQQLDT